jgi:predicted ribosome quality control (RQC) complex YloA/Tae2 family protein
VLDALSPLIAGARLQRLVQSDEHSLCLEFYGWDDSSDAGAKRVVLLSCHPQFGRITTAAAMPKAPKWPPSFAAFLKSRLGRDKLTRLRIIDDDRQVGLRFEGKDGGLEIVLSLMGPRSNIFALDLEGKLLAAMKPLNTTRNDLHIGAEWTSPPRRMETGTLTRWPRMDGETLLGAVREYYDAAENDAGFEYLQNILRSAIRRELDFAQRKEINLKRDLDAAKNAREGKRLGELLKSVMDRVKPGDRSVVAKDYETGEDVTVPLDPTLSAAENMMLMRVDYGDS